LAVKLGPFIAVAASPVPVTVTCAVAVAVPEVCPVYCTMIVQLEPALTVKPETQVPPVIEKVPVVPLPAVLVTVGAAVKMNGPPVAPVAVLLKVIVPV